MDIHSLRKAEMFYELINYSRSPPCTLIFYLLSTYLLVILFCPALTMDGF